MLACQGQDLVVRPVLDVAQLFDRADFQAEGLDVVEEAAALVGGHGGSLHLARREANSEGRAVGRARLRPRPAARSGRARLRPRPALWSGNSVRTPGRGSAGASPSRI